MKKTIFLIIALCYCAITFSQTFNYQSVVRDSEGDPIANQSMGVLVRIIAGSPSGSVLYNEAHTVTSNDKGVITLPIGGGTSGANFLAIDWGTQNHWIDIQIDLAGGTNYTQIGTSQLRFVPYAMYALNSTTSTDAGPFDYTNGVISNGNGNITTDDFVFGSSQLDVNGSFAPLLNNRLFFDKSKAAFRAGYTPGDEWDEANVGVYSVAFGESAMASNTNTFAMGRNANATGLESFAFGTNAGGFADYAKGFGLNARAYGQHSIAIGTGLNANSFGEIQLGQYSVYASGTPDTWVATDRLLVIGNGQEDINLGLNSNALVMLKNGNTTLNGTLTIDGDNQGAGSSFTLPAQDGTANQIMQTDGVGNVSWVTPAADAIPNGGSNGEILSTDGSGALSWVTNDDADADPTNEIELPIQTDESGKFLTTDGTAVSWQNVPNELPNNGTNGQVLSTDGSGVYAWVDQTATASFNTANDITSNGNEAYGTNDFIFGAPINQTGFDVSSANRIFFDKSKAAIRIGRDIGGFNAFADSNVGGYSAAFGLNPKAGGENAFAAGFIPNASGRNAIAMGNTVNATNISSIAMGDNNTASGAYSVALGHSLTAETYGQTTIGYLNTSVTGNVGSPVTTDRLFVIGNGTVDAVNGNINSDALVVLKNGNTTLNGQLTIDGDNQGMGTSYTLPAQDGTANQIMATDGSGNVSWTDAASRSMGAFSTTANITSNANGTIATDDFVFGSTQLADDSSTSDDNRRLFFDKSKGALRAGSDSNSSWDDTNVGIGSVAFGSNNIANNYNSLAQGDTNTINGDTSFAFGSTNTVNGKNAMTMGHALNAESFGQTSLGLFNTEVSGNTTSVVATDRLFVLGNGTSSLEKSDALVVLKNGNTTLNGQLTIDGDNQGMGTSYTLPAQDGTVNQVMTTDGSGNVSWAMMSTGLPSGGTNGQILQTDGAGNYSWANDATGTSVFSTTANVTSNANGTLSTDNFVFGSTQLDDDGVDNSGDETKFFFNKTKGAFRAGTSVEQDGFSGAWNNPAVGNYSVALGRGSIATNTASAALGSYNQVNGEDAFAAGRQNLASRPSSIALGANNSVSGQYAVGLGRGSQATSYGQQTIGLFSEGILGTYNNYVATDALFVIGNGPSDEARSNALVMLKNGNTTLNGQLTIDGDNIGAGASYTLPAQDGTANQIMATDGAGNVAWTNAAASLPSGGANGQILQTDGAGNYSWVNDATGTSIFSTTTNVTSNANGNTTTDDFVFGSTQLNDTGVMDDDRRLFFDKSKGALRAGQAQNTQWDDANVGPVSIALGSDNIASSSYSVALGSSNTSSGAAAISSGFYNFALGRFSGVFGSNNTAASRAEFVIGEYNTNAASASVDSWVTTDRLFVVGNGVPGARSNALVMLKNGNTTLNGPLTIDGDNAGSGASYTLPAQDGAANEVMTTDGSGNASWSSDIEATSVKIPSLPAFNVTSNASSYTTVGEKEVGNWNSTVNTDLFNDGNHLNLTNGRFTAPVKGLYFFSAQVRIDGVGGTSGSAYSRLMIVKNGDKKSFRNGIHSIRNVDAATAYWDTQHVSGILKLDAGDYVSVFIESAGDANFVLQTESGFNGYLVNKL